MDPRGDSFDCLPDGVLHHILSFLPFKEAARTCILSTRWIDLWTSTTNIELIENYFTEEVDGEKQLSRSAFIDFARRFIHDYQGRKVVKFRLCMSSPNDYQSDVEGWIKFAVSRDVEEIYLDFPEVDPHQEQSFELPSILFEHTSLRVVSFTSCTFDPAELIKFRSIECLHVERATLSTRALENLLNNCHFLESLCLRSCKGIDFIRIFGQNLRLRYLTLEDCGPIRGLSIYTPDLRSYKYFGTIDRYDHLDMQSAVDVDIDFGMETEYRNLGDTLSENLRGLCHVNTLRVCSYTQQILSSGVEPFYIPDPLVNMKHLIFKTGMHVYELPGIACLLRSCPCLETLTLEMGATLFLNHYEYPYGPVMSSQRFWASQMLPFHCFQGYLKTIRIDNFTMSDNVLDFVKFLLERARHLQNLIFATSKLTPWAGWNLEARGLFFRKLSCKTASSTIQFSIS
ncbi:putative F-box/LRR-repeat protein At1g56400 [Magnolia sinica]|uniref:putative F-box/LRR-repeat protein At1g56400 n=1 Tax=Magnolia sinica TaxID=86752 RepID=UPI00265918B7|nr:putative F-box/LRR-repeat protein At1g56400 [Magnolia sinica]